MDTSNCVVMIRTSLKEADSGTVVLRCDRESKLVVVCIQSMCLNSRVGILDKCVEEMGSM